MLFIDRPLAEYFRRRTGAIYHFATFVTHFGEAAWSLVPSLVLFLIARLIHRNPATAANALFVFVSVAAAGILNDIVKFIVGRARPWVLFSDGIYSFSQLQLHANYQSFPSGHTACAVSAGVALAVLLPRYRAICITTGLLIALTRVIVVSHYLSDVVAGAVLAWLVVHALKRSFARNGLDICCTTLADAPMLRSAFAAKLVGDTADRCAAGKNGLPALPALQHVNSV
jgi:membrane-associated phospholipid phosphatase